MLLYSVLRNSVKSSAVRVTLPVACKVVSSTTVLQHIIGSPADDHRNDRAAVEAAHEPGARTRWRWTWAHGVQAAPGVPRGLKPLGRGAARRKARGSGGENLARSAARKAYAAIHNAP